MILTYKLDQRLHRHLLRRLCCPVCLSPLFHSFVDERIDHLVCDSCKSTFLVVDRLPILLLDDENWQKKADEIDGEVTFNTKKIPMEVHLERNAFVDKNTETFLKESRADLSNDDILIVGCSFAELEFFAPKSKSVVALDIVPSLAKDCFEATQDLKIPAAWVCGDGEYLPFEDESFDTVIIRQTLHHMLKYYSGICDFFRVCKRGGRVLIVDEPFSSPDLNDLPLSSLPDEFLLYQGLKIGQIREKLNIPRVSPTQKTEKIDLSLLETEGSYIEPDRRDPETFLADKYHSFSLLNCIFALRLHTTDFELIWSREIAWNDESGETVRFCHGPNPHYDKPLLDKFISPCNVSLAARKTARTSVFRDRSTVRALPLDLAYKLAGA